MKWASGLAALLMGMGGTLWAADSATLPFHDDFHGGLQAAWHVLAGEAKVAEQPEWPGQRFLELSPGSVVILQTKEPVGDFVVEAKVRFIKRKGDNAEAPFLLRARPGGDQARAGLLDPTSQCRDCRALDLRRRHRQGVLAGAAQRRAMVHGQNRGRGPSRRHLARWAIGPRSL